MKLYTKTGDEGLSNLANGQRLAKDSTVFDVLGTIDECNSWIGFSISIVEDSKLRKHLMRIQDQLLIIGGVIAGSKKVKFHVSEITWLEKEIDRYQAIFGEEWYKKFLLPGGTELAARLDITRTVCRRAERVLVEFDAEQHFLKIRKYFNRLSDYLFALRCFINHSMRYEETQFQPKYLKQLEN